MRMYPDEQEAFFVGIFHERHNVKKYGWFLLLVALESNSSKVTPYFPLAIGEYLS